MISEVLNYYLSLIDGGNIMFSMKYRLRYLEDTTYQYWPGIDYLSNIHDYI